MPPLERFLPLRASFSRFPTSTAPPQPVRTPSPHLRSQAVLRISPSSKRQTTWSSTFITGAGTTSCGKAICRARLTSASLSELRSPGRSGPSSSCSQAGGLCPSCPLSWQAIPWPVPSQYLGQFALYEHAHTSAHYDTAASDQSICAPHTFHCEEAHFANLCTPNKQGSHFSVFCLRPHFHPDRGNLKQCIGHARLQDCRSGPGAFGRAWPIHCG